MRRLIAALIFMMIGAGGMYAAFEYHVVQSKEGWLFVPKTQAGLEDTFADIREWKATTWKDHPRLAQDGPSPGGAHVRPHRRTAAWRRSSSCSWLCLLNH